MMENESEKKIIKLYNTYKQTRKMFDVNSDKINNESNLDSEEKKFDVAEEQVISLYRQFQSERIPNKESIIENVMLAANARAIQNVDETQPEINPVSSLRTTDSAQAIWKNILSIFTFNSSNHWQTAAAFSLVIIVTGLISTSYLAQKNQDAEQLASIPQVLYENSQSITNNINFSLNPQFGFSSNQDKTQIAFRLGVLSVDLPLLAKMENRSKLQKVLVQESMAANSDSEVKMAVDKIVAQIDAAESLQNRISLINDFVSLINEQYFKQDIYPVMEFGNWLETTLLSTQLSDDKSFPLLEELLQLHNAILARANNYLLEEPGVQQYIEILRNADYTSKISDSDRKELRKTLQQIKAVML